MLDRDPPPAQPAAGGAGAPLLPRPRRGRDRRLDADQPGHGQVHHLPRAGRARTDPRGAVMNTIEDRIRAATRAAADTVPPDSVPPLRLPAERARPIAARASGRTSSSWGRPAGAGGRRGGRGRGRHRRGDRSGPCTSRPVGPSGGTSGPGRVLAGPPVSLVRRVRPGSPVLRRDHLPRQPEPQPLLRRGAGDRQRQDAGDDPAVRGPRHHRGGDRGRRRPDLRPRRGAPDDQRHQPGLRGAHLLCVPAEFLRPGPAR